LEVGCDLCDGCHADVDLCDAGLESFGDEGIELGKNGNSIAAAGVVEVDGGVIAEAALQRNSKLGECALLSQEFLF
jgi:hypothetical protein